MMKTAPLAAIFPDRPPERATHQALTASHVVAKSNILGFKLYKNNNNRFKRNTQNRTSHKNSNSVLVSDTNTSISL